MLELLKKTLFPKKEINFAHVPNIHLAKPEDVPAIKQVVNAAYKKLGDMGFNCAGITVDEETILRKMQKRDTYVVTINGKVVGTVSFRVKTWESTGGSRLYLTQLAVLPEYQGQHLASYLFDLADDVAREKGQSIIRLDTVAKAKHLVDLYLKKGFHVLREVQWNGRNYKSVIMERDVKPKAVLIPFQDVDTIAPAMGCI